MSYPISFLMAFLVMIVLAGGVMLIGPLLILEEEEALVEMEEETSPDIELADYEWRCGLQYHLLGLIQSDEFQLYDAEGEAVDPRQLIATQSMYDELYYYDAYTAFWPDFEEICVMADFDIVILGGIDKVIYGIDWQDEQILLYATFKQEATDEDPIQLLQQGGLAYVIIPDEPMSKPLIETALFP